MWSVSLRHRSSALIWLPPQCRLLPTGGSNVTLTLQVVRELRRFYSGSGSSGSDGRSRAASANSSPKVVRTQGFAAADTKRASGADLPPIIDTPAPPRPAFYVPPEERDPSDESLAFLRPGSPLEHLTQHHVDAPVPAELDRAPFLVEREKSAPTYMDADAARVQSTSVHAGQPLLSRRSVVDTSSYYYSSPREELGEGLSSTAGSIGATRRSRLHTFQNASLRQEHASAPLESGGGSSTPKERSIFTSSHEFATIGKSVEEMEDEKLRATPKPAVKQLEADIKKLEYYYGTPQYEKLLADFRKKYGGDGNTNDTSTEDGINRAASGRTYTAPEVDRGLDTQPIDYLRSSPKLQAELVSGPRAYDPVTIMQQQGVMRFQGYAFPPTVELGKLKGDSDQLKALHDKHRSHPLVARVRRGFNALIGRKDARDDYVVAGDRPKEDTHLIYRTLGLDAVQRRQMRYMLTDFDHADRHTAFHVMMSYPYTDWLHVFYMVLVGWSLYQLQVRWGAYEFYDEYMGLDLRQVPRLEKPVLAGITIALMVFLLFQPLLVASIATTRAYRIVMRRPIGPP
ncbi:hypothetical protein ABL78_1088 [Leptomonas seymouri]|uniref:Transmembrane protein n=1 Tax=Leptomonas seymouri TaxID=5684 RepID=A0A0N1PF35_LEPSE|nr:hypothetical protein ABL78_1088 [Leptomonas seymouri]|eukprot:KPI89825.1 hypothetical protein ABL78_1088 [Leptomonas seymouri]